MIVVRRLAGADWQAFRHARLSALAEQPGNFFRALAEEEPLPDAHWRALLDRPDSAIFGLFDPDAEGAPLVGITSVYTDRTDPAGATAGLGMTWVAPGWRGRGLTRLIYGARIEWARARGFRRIAVSHRDGNEPSRRAIVAHGFSCTGSRAHRWPDGALADDIQYILALAPEELPA